MMHTTPRRTEFSKIQRAGPGPKAGEDRADQADRSRHLLSRHTTLAHVSDDMFAMAEPKVPQMRRSSKGFISVPDGASYPNGALPASTRKVSATVISTAAESGNNVLSALRAPVMPIRRLGTNAEPYQHRRDSADFARKSALREVVVHPSGSSLSQPRAVRQREVAAPRQIVAIKPVPEQFEFVPAKQTYDSRKQFNDQFRVEVSDAMYASSQPRGRERVNAMRIKQQADFKAAAEKSKAPTASKPIQAGRTFLKMQ